MNALKFTLKEIGWRGLFRGWTPIAVMGIPSQVLYFSVNEYTRELIQDSLHGRFFNLSPVFVDGIQSIASGVIANSLSLIPFVPADVIRYSLDLWSSFN